MTYQEKMTKKTLKHLQERLVVDTSERLDNHLEREDRGWPLKGSASKHEAWELLDDDVATLESLESKWVPAVTQSRAFQELVDSALR